MQFLYFLYLIFIVDITNTCNKCEVSAFSEYRLEFKVLSFCFLMHVLMMAYLKPKRVNVAGFIPVKYKLYSTGKIAGLLPCCLQHNGMYHLNTLRTGDADLRFQHGETRYICKFSLVPLHKGECFHRYYTLKHYQGLW